MNMASIFKVKKMAPSEEAPWLSTLHNTNAHLIMSWSSPAAA
jgi:hypothetical protein